MNAYDTTPQGAPFTGADAANPDARDAAPLTIAPEVIRRSAQLQGEESTNILSELSDEQREQLKNYLCTRLASGVITRNRRTERYSRIDRAISTWQKLDPIESERDRLEDATGKQMALPMNLPVLASHLNDMVAYYAEALAPISNPFFKISGEGEITALTEKMNRDAIIRDYFGQLALTLRSLLKYNVGGFAIEWQPEGSSSMIQSEKGNYWRSLDMYNTLWDPAIRNPKHVSQKAEWTATICLENRLQLMRKSLSGEWYGLENYLATQYNTSTTTKYYREAVGEAAMDPQGQDSRTSAAQQKNSGVDWGSYGLGLATDMGPEVSGFEVIDMYCWLVPAQFGLLTEAERAAISDSNRDPESFLELWHFELLGDNCVLSAVPYADRAETLGDVRATIPLYLARMTQDQLEEAQRSFMELMRGFQRYTSAMFNIYIAGMRKNVWGVKAVDPTMFDVKALKQGDTVGIIESKQTGRDVRSGLMALDQTAGVENILGSVNSVLGMKDQFFPSQALPSQVAGIDRAVKSQVATVIQGASRTLRMILRVLDSSLMLPTRMEAYRNLKRYDSEGIESLTDEVVAKLTGSGIESMEAERVAEALQNLLFAIIQNQEASSEFDVPSIMTYMSRVMNLSVDLGQFARQPQQAQPPEGETPPPTA